MWSAIVRSLAVRVAATALACAVCAQTAGATSKYVINEPIYDHLRKTDDNLKLCSHWGMSMNSLVLFIAKGGKGVAVYWDRRTDLFVQYPGSSACVVWMRKG